MFICVCKKVTEDEILRELKANAKVKDIIKKYNCTQCKLCIPYIITLYKNNAG